MSARKNLEKALKEGELILAERDRVGSVIAATRRQLAEAEKALGVVREMQALEQAAASLANPDAPLKASPAVKAAKEKLETLEDRLTGLETVRIKTERKVEAARQALWDAEREWAEEILAAAKRRYERAVEAFRQEYRQIVASAYAVGPTANRVTLRLRRIILPSLDENAREFSGEHEKYERDPEVAAVFRRYSELYAQLVGQERIEQKITTDLVMT